MWARESSHATEDGQPPILKSFRAKVEVNPAIPGSPSPSHTHSLHPPCNHNPNTNTSAPTTTSHQPPPQNTPPIPLTFHVYSHLSSPRILEAFSKNNGQRSYIQTALSRESWAARVEQLYNRLKEKTDIPQALETWSLLSVLAHSERYDIRLVKVVYDICVHDEREDEMRNSCSWQQNW